MRFIIELDGVVIDIAPAWHLAHQRAAVDVGWSRLDRATFWRLMRTKGAEADFLPGARPIKIKEYLARFEAVRESDDAVAAFALQPDVAESLRSLNREGTCVGVTLGANLAARHDLISRGHLLDVFAELQPLSADPRRRPVELKALADRDPRTVVVASTATLARSADAAELFCVGIPSGPCTPARLHQAGVRLVVPALAELATAARVGATELVAHGLPPERLG